MDRKHGELSENNSLEKRVFCAARQLFYEKGYYATTTREIALRAGTSETGVFRKYPSKYGLLMAVYNDAWRVVNEALGLQGFDDSRYEILRIFGVLAKLYETDRLTVTFILINTGNTDTLLLERKEEAIISEQNLRYIERVRTLCHQAVKKRLVDRAYTVNSLTEVILGIYEGTLLGWYLADNTKSYSNRVTNQEMVRALGRILSVGAAAK